MGNTVFQERVGQRRAPIISPAHSVVDDIPAPGVEHRGVRRVEVLHLAFGLGPYLRRCPRVTVRVINLSQPPVGTVNLALVGVLLNAKNFMSSRHDTIIATPWSAVLYPPPGLFVSFAASSPYLGCPSDCGRFGLFFSLGESADEVGRSAVTNVLNLARSFL